MNDAPLAATVQVPFTAGVVDSAEPPDTAILASSAASVPVPSAGPDTVQVTP